MLTCVSIGVEDDAKNSLVSLVIENRIECLFEKIASIGLRILSAFLLDVENDEENVSISLNAVVLCLLALLVFDLKMFFKKFNKNSKS